MFLDPSKTSKDGDPSAALSTSTAGAAISEGTEKKISPEADKQEVMS